MESRLRASTEQFSLMLEFMESHGDLSRPQPGLQGRQRGDQLWQELTDLLNSVGGSAVTKSADKWKRVWSDWKTKTKKKASVLNRDMHGTGGGPATGRPLNPAEERLMRIIGLNSITGQQAIQELGFNIQEPDLHPQVAENPRCDETGLVLAPPDTITVVSTPVAPPSYALPGTSQHEGISPESRPSSPHHRRTRQRRLRQTPFDRASSEFVRIEEARIALEGQRDARLFELETERLKLEAHRVRIEEGRARVDEERARTEAERSRIEAERQINERTLSDSIILLNNNVQFLISQLAHQDN